MRISIFSKSSIAAALAGSALLGTFAIATPAFAAGPMGYGRPAVAGTVASISGSTLTVTARSWQRGSTGTTPTTYTVDATSATVTKNGTASSVSAIAVGDMVSVQGTVSGTSVTATSIADGIGRMGRGRGPDMMHASTTPAFTGNGQPVVAGTVSAVSGNTITLATKAGTTYTVDATSATIVKPGVTGATIANIVVGDAVVVQGAVNGSNITASSVSDGAAPGAGAGAKPAGHGILGAIGGFFSHLFGFF